MHAFLYRYKRSEINTFLEEKEKSECTCGKYRLLNQEQKLEVGMFIL